MPKRADEKYHRVFGVDLFNYVWTLLVKKRRTRDEDLRMIHAAHASRYHWEHVGTRKNLAIGEWQVSRVYAVLKRPEPALYHAKRCLEICKRYKVGDFPLAFAYEALARAFAIAERRSDRDRYIRLAERAGRSIHEPEDRELLRADLATIPRH